MSFAFGSLPLQLGASMLMANSEQHKYINFIGQYLKLEQPLQKCQLGWLGQAETV